MQERYENAVFVQVVAEKRIRTTEKHRKCIYNPEVEKTFDMKQKGPTVLYSHLKEYSSSSGANPR